MNYLFPHTIQNCVGEKIIFERIEQTAGGDRVVGEAFCQPGCGPIMHTHFKQDEGLTVVSGKMGYQVFGDEPRLALPGDTIVFKRGTPHRFWAEGGEILHFKAWVEPVNTFIFFITSVFEAQNKSGSGRPEMFDGAYLVTRYASEYDLDLPRLVKKVVMPLTCRFGKLLGKYRHFADAPEPLK